MSYLNKCIKKPWGVEYCLFENNQFSIWHLIIKPGQSTSLHSHTNKVTGLLVLDGLAEVSFINETHRLCKLEKKIIRKGVFHQTKNPLKRLDLHLLEVEQPNDKKDILRLEDNYRRSCQPFSDDFIDKTSEINFKNNLICFNDIAIDMVTIHSLDEIDLSNDPIILVDGEIYEQHIKVLIPGSMTDLQTFKRLAYKFSVKFPIKYFRFYAT